MVDRDEYFPRGGKKPVKQFYKQENNFLGASENTGKKKKKGKTKSIDDDGYLSEEFEARYDESSKNCSNGINYKVIKEGMLLLGRVRLVLSTMIHIALPSKLRGIVMACHISETHNKQLEAYVNDQVQNVIELRDMFKPGQYVAVKVLKVENNGVMLSMMPQHVNGMYLPSDICRGMLLQAAVSSVEDHGYVMELGIENTRAFLPKNMANEDIELVPGILTWCIVKNITSTENSIITVTNDLKTLQDSVIKRPIKSKSVLLPGTAVEFVIDKALNNGIEGSIFKDTIAYIQRQHADSRNGKKPQLGQRIRARILYEKPISRMQFLIMKNIFESTHPNLNDEQKYKDGDIVENAQVIKLTGRSIVFKLGSISIGNMTLKRVQIDEDLSDEEVVAKSYPLGSHHKVRILCYNLMDYMYSVSDQKDILQERYFTYDDIDVGDIVDAQVKRINDNNIILSIGRFTGVVPEMHIFDTGIYVDPKAVNTSKLTKKKFKVGQPVKARVLLVKREASTVVLTMKPSLMSPELNILKDYESAAVGKSYTGFVVKVGDYIKVAFFKEVIAKINKKHITREPVENLRDLFHIGQIVNCTILNVNLEKKLIFGSFITAPFDPVNKKELKNKDNLKHKHKLDLNASDVQIPLKKTKTDIKPKKPKNVINQNDSGIETHEDTDHNEYTVLTVDDMSLINMDDCVTKKNFKKRVVSILKSIKNRNRRIDVIEKKIEGLEEIGLDVKNKKLHTAMHKEKLIIEERIKLLLEALNVAQSKLREFPDESNEHKNEKKLKRNDEFIFVSEEDKKSIKAMKNIKVADESIPALKVPSVKDFWFLNTEPTKNEQLKDDSSDSDEEVQEQPKKKRKKLSGAEKEAKARAEEQKLRDLEKRITEQEMRPQSTDQFERALLANPNSSELWIAYMAFHLQATEVERARAVGRKALSTISFREEQEKLNVWLAMLNLENRFGTKESQQKTLEEALQMNDTFKVHSKLLDIYVDTSKVQELSSLVDIMMRKYKRDPTTYVISGGACYNLGLIDKARSVMQKAITVLEKKEHIQVIVQFALLERSHGEKERAEALLEQIVGVYPQRVDVWCVYVDMLHKANDIENVRQVMERATSQNLPARKMKSLYKKWIEIEEKIGDQKEMDRIRQKAMDYIEKAKF